MKGRSLVIFFLRFAAVGLLVETVILVVLGLIGWRQGWDIEGYRNSLQYTGLLVIGLGLFGIKGNWDTTRSFSYQYSTSVIDQSSWERAQQTIVDFSQAFGFMLLMFLVGGINLLIGWLI